MEPRELDILLETIDNLRYRVKKMESEINHLEMTVKLLAAASKKQLTLPEVPDRVIPTTEKHSEKENKSKATRSDADPVNPGGKRNAEKARP